MSREPSNRFARHPRATRLAVVLTAVLLADFLAASAYRGVAGDLWWRSREASERRYRRPSALYHHDLAKNVALDDVQWRAATYTVNTNSLRFRDNSVRDVPLVAERRRIVFMGDSFTQGVGIDYPMTFVGRIAEALSAKGIEVLNAGVSSYSPIIYWKKTQHLVEKLAFNFDEMVVFLDISHAHDRLDDLLII